MPPLGNFTHFSVQTKARWNLQFAWWKWILCPKCNREFLILLLWDYENWRGNLHPPSGNCHGRKTVDLCKRFRFSTDSRSFRHKLEAIDRHESRVPQMQMELEMQTENAIENGGKKIYCNCCDKTQIKNCVNCQATCDRNWEQAQMHLLQEKSGGGGSGGVGGEH